MDKKKLLAGSPLKPLRAMRKSSGAIVIPANAYATDSTHDKGWECMRGSLENDGNCTALNIPKNAFLDSHGKKLQCARGYKNENNYCIKIIIPKNAYLKDEGDDWRCARGFEKESNVLLTH